MTTTTRTNHGSPVPPVATLAAYWSFAPCTFCGAYDVRVTVAADGTRTSHCHACYPPQHDDGADA